MLTPKRPYIIRSRLSQVLIPGTTKVITSKHVTFDESTYPLSGTQSKTVRFEEGYFDESGDIIENANDKTANDQSMMKHLPTVRKEEMHGNQVLSETQQNMSIGSLEANVITLDDLPVNKVVRSNKTVENR